VPELLYQLVSRHHLTDTDQQQSEERALLPAPQGKRLSILDDLELAEHPELHASIEQGCKKVARGCRDAPPVSDDGRSRMGSIAAANNDGFADAIARGDAAAAAAVYSDDARLLPPGSEALRGRCAAERFWRDGIEAGLCGIELETLGLEQHEGSAYEVGRYVLAFAPTTAEPRIDRGKYVVIHKRQPDGTWRWAIDIFNSDTHADLSSAPKEADQ
jgi:ketosteroid isomerase-like protein